MSLESVGDSPISVPVRGFDGSQRSGANMIGRLYNWVQIEFYKETEN